MTSIQHILFSAIEATANEKELEWVKTKANSDVKAIQIAFVSAPRFIRKVAIRIDEKVIHSVVPDWQIEEWTLERLVRVYLLLHIPNEHSEDYVKNIETLFDTAEINELVALYSALPVLSYPEKWLFRATEAVRSNMGVVFDAIGFGNPYPFLHFSELAWNQLVLKCIFNDKPIHLIVGLKKRANRKLAETLSDFAHERWAADRKVPAQVWRLVTDFMNDTILADLDKLFQSNDIQNQTAAALVCSETSFPGAESLLENYPQLRASIQKGQLSWKQLEVHQLCYV
ncbi:EboA domain-containing protein [Flectobacillus roseus]|uniref:EboA domain-containing protein n=1 Tax=Flectobacillus roseus TaxID=502259 RepID=UPI0024B66251|nr:EboA domain-containing protein [Flectobacillus roseus]MDI9869083.1 EboA domain-containing protein [Flectobacillus roseus]